MNKKTKTDLKLTVDAITDDVLTSTLALQKHYIPFTEKCNRVGLPLKGNSLRRYLKKKGLREYRNRTSKDQTQIHYYYE